MNRKELTDSIQHILPDKKQAEKVVISIFETIKSTLRRKEKVVISSFGTFIPIEKKPALRRNPRTNQKVLTDIRRKIRFKPSKTIFDNF